MINLWFLWFLQDCYENSWELSLQAALQSDDSRGRGELQVTALPSEIASQDVVLFQIG